MSLYVRVLHIAEVEFEYDAEQPDELTLHVGDIIKNCRVVEDGWMEGELNGKRGIFPDNFVVKKEITPTPGVYILYDEHSLCVQSMCCVCMHGAKISA